MTVLNDPRYPTTILHIYLFNFKNETFLKPQLIAAGQRYALKNSCIRHFGDAAPHATRE